MIGRIIKAVSGFYYVMTETNTLECKARGKFRKDGTSLLVGDNVEVTITENGKGAIETVLDRQNSLYRPPIANIDKLFIVSSAVTPTPNFLLIDRLTALCEFKNITPIIVFNKSDMADLKEFAYVYSRVGYKTIVCSAYTHDGLEEIISELNNCVCAFTGNSGVGKSSILNSLFPDLNLDTSEVSNKLGRGRHTTRHTELFLHKYNGFVADTPGFSSLESDIYSLEFKEKLPFCFPEFEAFQDMCKFSDCKHICEKGCAVFDAVHNNIISEHRHNSYTTIYNELKDLKHWNIH